MLQHFIGTFLKENTHKLKSDFQHHKGLLEGYQYHQCLMLYILKARECCFLNKNHFLRLLMKKKNKKKCWLKLQDIGASSFQVTSFVQLTVQKYKTNLRNTSEIVQFCLKITTTIIIIRNDYSDSLWRLLKGKSERRKRIINDYYE